MARFGTEELILAFAYHVLGEMAHADGRLDPAEKALREASFPKEKLLGWGFATPTGALTPRFEEARDQALERLPVELDEAGKLDLLTRFLDMAVIDGHLDRTESSLLYKTAHLLGLSSSAFDAHLDTLDQVGEVDLPEPEADED